MNTIGLAASFGRLTWAATKTAADVLWRGVWVSCFIFCAAWPLVDSNSAMPLWLLPIWIPACLWLAYVHYNSAASKKYKEDLQAQSIKVHIGLHKERYTMLRDAARRLPLPTRIVAISLGLAMASLVVAGAAAGLWRALQAILAIVGI